MSNERYFDPAVAYAQIEREMARAEKKAKRRTLRQIIKYAICTASAGLIEFITFTILTETPILSSIANEKVWFFTENNMAWFVATAIALFLSIVWNFTINRKFTFKSAGNVPRAMTLAFLFYVPFFPFKLWFNSYMPTHLGVDPLLIEVITMLLNGVLEFCWQKFVIYRKEQDTAPAKHEIGTIGEFGEIATEQPEVTASDLLQLMKAGVDITADDKTLKKELKALNKEANA